MWPLHSWRTPCIPPVSPKFGIMGWSSSVPFAVPMWTLRDPCEEPWTLLRRYRTGSTPHGTFKVRKSIHSSWTQFFYVGCTGSQAWKRSSIPESLYFSDWKGKDFQGGAGCLIFRSFIWRMRLYLPVRGDRNETITIIAKCGLAISIESWFVC